MRGAMVRSWPVMWTPTLRRVRICRDPRDPRSSYESVRSAPVVPPRCSHLPLIPVVSTPRMEASSLPEAFSCRGLAHLSFPRFCPVSHPARPQRVHAVQSGRSAEDPSWCR